MLHHYKIRCLPVKFNISVLPRELSYAKKNSSLRRLRYLKLFLIKLHFCEAFPGGRHLTQSVHFVILHSHLGNN